MSEKLDLASVPVAPRDRRSKTTAQSTAGSRSRAECSLLPVPLRSIELA